MTEEQLREIVGRLASYDAVAKDIGSCGDGYCVVLHQKGQHTNGGCRCSDDRNKARRMMAVGDRLAKAVRAALSQEKGR